jgi:hypothetical protein
VKEGISLNLKAHSEIFEDLRENICFPGSFCENVCKTGANARTAV